MTRKELDRIFTAKVQELLTQGFQISTSTMGGSQGEIAHVDFTDGSEIYRLYMEKTYRGCEFYNERIKITFGKNTERLGTWGTIWNNHLEVISEIVYREIGGKWYTTDEEAEKACAKAVEHFRSKDYSLEINEGKLELTPQRIEIAHRWLKKQPRMKTCKPEDITEIRKHTYGTFKYHKRTFEYIITAKGKQYTLYAPVA